MSEPDLDDLPLPIVDQKPRAQIVPSPTLTVALDTEDELDLETEDGEPLVIV